MTKQKNLKKNIFNSLSEIPDEYWEDENYRSKKKYLEWLKEERKKKREELEKYRAFSTKHYSELSRLRRIIGQLYGILALMLADEENCRKIAIQLKSASSVLRKMSAYVLKKHGSICLSKKNFTGTENEKLKEARLTLQMLEKLYGEFKILGISEFELEDFYTEMKRLEESKSIKKLKEKN